jgi:hypothetical protein
MAALVTEIGEEALSSLEWVTLATSALEGDGSVVDDAHGVTPQLVVGSLTAVGTHGGGRGSLEESPWWQVVKGLLTGLYNLTNYMCVCVGL